MKKDTLITVLILAGLVLGAILGQILHVNLAEGEALNPIWMDLGDIVLIRPLKLMVIPLVFLSVVVGVTSIGDPSKLGLVGGSTLAACSVLEADACGPPTPGSHPARTPDSIVKKT